MSAKIEIRDLGKAISDILDEYGDEVYEATEAGLDEAEKALIHNLKSNSPEGKTKKYKKAWKSKGKKYKLKRYVHNTKMVENSDGDKIPLSNILEYSEESKHQGNIRRTFESSSGDMTKAFVDEFNKKI